MYFILNILLLVSLLKYLQTERSPMTCAVLWAIGSTLFMFFFNLGSGSFWYILLMAPIRFGLSLLYFHLLEKFDESYLYWVILILGLAIILL
ncbi:MAG: hypothetical protein ACYC27_13860 [Armatimonadota bacterium]